MGKVTRICALLLMLAILTSMTGCETKSFQYTFRQNRSNVEKVEICSFDYYHDKTIKPLITLSDSDIDAILSDLSAMECYSPSFVVDPIISFGDIIICITYFNQEKELLGIWGDYAKWTMEINRLSF